jgi:hypothetical protein
VNLESLRQELRAGIDDPKCAAEFFFLVEIEGDLAVMRADIATVAANELTGALVRHLRTTLVEDEALTLIDLSAADDRANVVYRYDLPDAPLELRLLGTVLTEAEFGNFSFSHHDLSDLKGILVVLSNGEKHIALYKHHYPVELLKRESLAFVRKANQNRLEKLPGDVLRIGPKCEFVQIGDDVVILDLKALERFFGFHAAIRNVAERGLESIREAHLVEELEPLIERLDDVQFARKVVRATHNSPVLGKIPTSEVIAFIESHPALRGKIRFNADKSLVRLDTKVSQNLLLRLLNDDYLHSELTKRYYESLAKDDVLSNGSDDAS